MAERRRNPALDHTGQARRPGRVATAQELLDALLSAGWIELDEKREPGGRWVPVQITIIDFERCRETLGLPNRDREAAAWVEARSQVLSESSLADAAWQLDDLAPALALRRHRWLLALDRWSVERRSGTRRDFAYFASGQTKGIPAADWVWLAAVVDLMVCSCCPRSSRNFMSRSLCRLLDLTVEVIDLGQDKLAPIRGT